MSRVHNSFQFEEHYLNHLEERTIAKKGENEKTTHQNGKIGMTVVISTVPERQTFLSNTLSSLLEQSYQPDEVLIVTDRGKGERVRRSISSSTFDLLNVRVLESNGVGLSKARNRGVEASRGDIILFIDDDVILPDPDTLFKVMEAFVNDGRLGVYGVQVKPLFHNSVKLDDKYNWIFGCTDDNAIRPVGAFFAVRRECFNVVGLFDENLGRFGKYLLSGEETELFNRIRKYMGLKVVLDSNVRVYHLIHGRGWKYVIKRAFMEGISKARFENYDYSAEKSYLKRYLKDFPIGWLVVGATCLGFIVGKIVGKIKG